jgi:hypothetical protein
MSRDEPSFDQLINYINRGDGKEIFYNLLSNEKEGVIKEFEKNSLYLKDNHKGKNYLYHEVLSLKKNSLPIKELEEILIEVTQDFIKNRA